jgi:ribonuclease BN (tRNA processing enzyme)
MGSISRRGALALAGAAALSPAGWLRAETTVRKRSRLIFLGTKGGPRVTMGRGMTGHLLLVDEVPYVIDCGYGTVQKIVAAGVALPRIRHIFITHQHSDHNVDFGSLLLMAWASGLKTPVDCWGPPPLARIAELALATHAHDIDTRVADEGRPHLKQFVRVHEIATAGPVMQDDRVKVTAALVPHPPIVPSFAYRFDAPDRSIVFSGDTAPSDALVMLARGADVLVHEAMYLPAIDRLLARVPNAATLKKHLLDSHTAVEDVGRIAARAGVKLLVLSHLVPGDDPAVTDQMWIDGARQHFGGRIVVAQDMMEL